ncbi:hypothetical protein FNV43_RR08365 [Rhamnella rubrinervis]|uniref:Membrane-associated kinase regulator 2 n=1 Tax=Rhamnella rubrinervis TaxID=2594499 RepID=A0A8K0H8R6_9ROSA|nr:hypothetical protein FNV43_RR08365 [Rhamnella rubrinervis]
MEAFSLLKYWRGGGGVADVGVNVRPNTGTTTIVTAVTNTAETDDDDDDDGPFFDLEFALPDEDETEGGDESQNPEPSRGSDSVDDSDEEEDEDDESDGVEDEREFNFTLSSGSSNDRADPNLSMSPSDDLFFKGKLVPIESSSLVFNPLNPTPSLKSNGSVANASKQQQKQQPEPQQKVRETTGTTTTTKAAAKQVFTVKFKVEEVPIVSLFTRDNSSRISSANKSQKQSSEESSNSEEKRFTKEVMQKYLKIVKPLYVRVSKRYGEKLRFSGQLSLNGSVAKAAPPPATAPTQKPIPAKPPAEKGQAEPEVSEASPSNAKNQKQGNFPAGLRVVCKHLGKSRSASSAVAAAPPGTVASRRRDDSLLQQQDGIQSAILHCKRSFNASRDSESSLLSRSVSDPTSEKSLDKSRKSSDEGNDGAFLWGDDADHAPNRCVVCEIKRRRFNLSTCGDAWTYITAEALRILLLPNAKPLVVLVNYRFLTLMPVSFSSLAEA